MVIPIKSPKRAARPLLPALWGVFAALSLVLVPLAHGPADVSAAEMPASVEQSLATMKEETLSYFSPVAGRVTGVSGGQVTLQADSPQPLKPGMRLHAFREGVDFVHPVTKEPLGKVESQVGNIEVTAVGPDGAKGAAISGTAEDFLNTKIKIAGTKIRLLFFQGAVDWFLGDAYYQMLKESGRFELIDTGLDTTDTAKILAEAKAKGAEAALVLDSQEFTDHVQVGQKLFWVSDGKRFAEKTVAVEASGVRALRLQATRFLPSGEVLLSFHLPYNAQKLAVGDLDGDRSPEIVLVGGNKLRVYQPGVDLKFLWELTVPSAGEIIWIDTFDLNGNGRDELLITSVQGGGAPAGSDAISPSRENSRITSFIYELRGAEPALLWKEQGLFVRKLHGGAAAQKHHPKEGYDGRVLELRAADGAYRTGDELNVPVGANIYDFQVATSADGKRAFFAWDDQGYLNLYTEKGIRTWRSAEDFGGFGAGFKKDSPTVMIDRGTWSVKDRLLTNGMEVLVPKRKPMLGIARGLGYKSSEIKSLWWNGISVEERVFIENAGGEVLDYDILGDRMVVLSKVPLTDKAKNLLKGMLPRGVMVYVFSLKGR